jgi:hypothetical protein
VVRKIQQSDVVRRVEVDLVEGEINRRSIEESDQASDVAKQR